MAQSPPSQVAINLASGPLEQATPVDVVRFTDAVRASRTGTSEAVGAIPKPSSLEEVLGRLGPSGNESWAHVGKGLRGAIDGVSELEAKTNKPSFNVRVPLSSDNPRPAGGANTIGAQASAPGSGTDGVSGRSSNSYAEQFETVLDRSREMIRFSLDAELLTKTTEHTTSSIKQLSNGGGG